MNFFKKLFNSKEKLVIDAREITRGRLIPMPVIQEEVKKEEVKTPLVEITAAQVILLDAFKEIHKIGCGMDMYQIVIAHKDGKGDRMFAKCPICNHGVEIDSENTPPTRLF